MCSRVCGNRLIQTSELFEEILIDRFTDKFKAFFLPKYYIYLDILYLYYKYIDPNKSKFFGSAHYESRISSCEVSLTFLNVLVRVYVNNIELICSELESHPEILYE